LGILLIGSFAIFSLSFMQLSTASIEGQWKDPDGAIIQVYKKDNLYFGKIINFTKPEHEKKRAGKTPLILKNFKKKSANEYCCGTMKQIKEKRTVSGSLKLLDNNTLILKGKYMGFTGSKTWKRVK